MVVHFFWWWNICNIKSRSDWFWAIETYYICTFLRATAVPPGTAEARISYWNSVCLSVCLSVRTRYRFNAGWDRDSGSSPYDSLESLVFYEVIWCQRGRRFPSNEGIKDGYPPLRIRYFTTIGSSSVKTVVDRHRLAAYHSKHCRRAFQWYQLGWPWTTLNPKIWVLSDFLLF